MACRYTYQGKTYEAHEFDDVLRAMSPTVAAQFIPAVKAIPDAPFIGKTDAWLGLAIKRMVSYAAENGFDRVAFVNGQQSAERYDLSKQINSLRVRKNTSGNYTIQTKPTAEDRIFWPLKSNVTADELPDMIGKELAAKVIRDVEALEQQPKLTKLPEGYSITMDRQSDPAAPFTVTPDAQVNGRPFAGRHATEERAIKAALELLELDRSDGVVYSGLDLKVGGEGMKAFYDKIVPTVAKDVLKKLGGGPLTTVEMGKTAPTPGMFASEDDAEQWLVDNNITAVAKPKFEPRYQKWSIRGANGSVLKLPQGARERGTDPQDAVDYAQRYIFTYDDLPKGARRVRDFGIPFFSYTYKAVPALLHTALTHPLRMAAPAAVLWGINAAAYAIATGDDDDEFVETLKKYLTDPAFRAQAREKEKLEREYLPPWNKGTTALMTPKMIRLGMDEVTKLPLFIDVSRIIPGGDMFDVSPNAGGIPLPQPITPSHPLFTTAVAMLGNKDLFRGKDLVDKNDTRGEATEKRLEWLWTQLSPAVAAGNYHWERGMNALAQANGGEVKWMPDVLGGDATGVGRDGLPVQPKYAVAQTFGIKVRPIDLDTSAAIDKSMQRKLLRDIDTEMSALKRLEAKGAVSARAVDKARELADIKKDRIKQGLTVDGGERD